VQKNSTNGGQSHLRFQGSTQKRICPNFECNYLPICTLKIDEIFTTWSYTRELQDLMVRFLKRKEKLDSWVNTAEMAVLSGFWQKNGLGPLGFNNVMTKNPFMSKCNYSSSKFCKERLEVFYGNLIFN